MQPPTIIEYGCTESDVAHVMIASE
jgi:hypothetical protein